MWIVIKTVADLPKLGKYVLARHSLGTWHDSTDQANVNCVVVKRVPTDKFGENSNNKKPYRWLSFGPTSFDGQDIYAWQKIEPFTTSAVQF